MAISREEQLRNNRRFSRQIVGAVAIVLIIIGLFTVLSWVVGVLRSALDDTERRQSYADRLYGLVMFDTMPFDDVSKVDQSEFLQAAIWGAVYQIQKRDNGLSDYERDSETGSIILPKLEVDTYLTNLLGPDYKITDGSFQTEEFNYTYDEEKQGYLVPVTSMVAMYTTEVEKISTQSGKTYVPVGYIPTINNSSSGEINLTAPTEPTKYMDYVFTRGEGRKWYLSALQESDMQPEVSASTAVPTTDNGPAGTTNSGDDILFMAFPTDSGDPQELVQNNLDSSMADTGNAADGAADGTAEPDSTADDQTDAQSEPEADTGDTGGDTQDSSGTE